LTGSLRKQKSQSITYLLNESEHIYWILDLEDEVHSIRVIWTSGLQECKRNFIFQSRAEQAIVFGWDMKVLDLFCGVAYRCRIAGSGPYPPPLKVHRGRVSIHHGLRTMYSSLMQPLLSLGICLCCFSLTTSCTRSLVIIVVIGGIP
jgi:hypothetical protein